MPPPAPLPRPEQIASPEIVPQSDNLDAWGLLPRKPDWAGGFLDWVPGERGARSALKSFLPILADYEEQRNFPSRPGVSRLSPHIHFGEISPATLWHHAENAAGEKARSFLSEIAWREHGLNLIDQFPDYAQNNGRRLFDHFSWRSGPDADTDFRAWTKGRTGYPVVDAGMRELWQTGWMHNRVRMITASFLVKHLLLDWRRGERWFWDTLLDADIGANAMNWQYVAGSGVDAPVFSRMMAPFVQSPKFEMADYIRRFVPELAHLRDDEIHAPHDKGLTPLGYPFPIISHEGARARALAAWETCRRT
jgi:deoxyribodipyrimidine photo-lyase